MTRVCDVEKYLFAWAPRDLAAEWDNVGHLLGESEQIVNKILVSLDITESVIQEAIDIGADLIVSHHPLINCNWHPVQNVCNHNKQGRSMISLLRHNISAICMHTNLDAANGGVNDILAQKLGLHDLSMLNDEKIGRVGIRNGEISLAEFVRFVVKSLNGNGARYTDCGKSVHRVAVGGGACGNYIKDAIALGCDTFITSDLRYHEFLDAEGINLIDAGHFPTENVVIPALVERLQKVFPELSVLHSASHCCEVIQYSIKEK